MRKLLLALFAMALVVAFTAPSHAASFKMTGIYQVRGSTENVNEDGDDDLDDKANYLQALIRPRFTAVSGAVTAIWEPEFASPHAGFLDTKRQAVGVNRWLIDFAIPGSFASHELGKGRSFLAGQGNLRQRRWYSRAGGLDLRQAKQEHVAQHVLLQAKRRQFIR